ncbi:MAG TPA: VOC family protein [Pseudonocardia sp.]
MWFDGQAEAAADYYVSVFKDGKLGRVSRYTEAGPGPAGSVVTVEFEINGQKFIALNGGPEFRFTEAISFQIHCADQGEVDYYWNALTDGGTPVQCGWCQDRYGLSWQVVPTEMIELLNDPEPAKVARTTTAMLSMVKLDIAALRRAHQGG